MAPIGFQLFVGQCFQCCLAVLLVPDTIGKRCFTVLDSDRRSFILVVELSQSIDPALDYATCSCLVICMYPISSSYRFSTRRMHFNLRAALVGLDLQTA